MFAMLQEMCFLNIYKSIIPFVSVNFDFASDNKGILYARTGHRSATFSLVQTKHKTGERKVKPLNENKEAAFFKLLF